MAPAEDIRARLEAVAEELADLAYDAVRAQAGGDASAAATERRLTRARRAVERAAGILAGGDDA